MRKILSLFAALLFAGSLLATDYHLEQVYSVSVGKTYAFVRNDKALSTTGSGALKTSDVNYGTIDGTQDYLWKLVAADDSVKLQNLSKPTEKVSGETKDAFLRNSSSSNLSITSAEGSNLWKIKFADDDDWAMIVSSSKFVGETSSGAGTYKAYANNESNLGSHPYQLFVYELKEGSSAQPSMLANSLDIKTAIVSALPFALDTSIVVTADNLTEDITVTHTGSNLNTLPASLDKAGGKLTFKIFAAAEGKFSDTIVLASSGLTVKAAIEGTIVAPEGEGTKESPFSLADVAKINSGVSGKWWVQGFILGCATTGGAIKAEADSSSVLLGVSADATTGIAVQLAKSTNGEKATREALAIQGSTGKIGKEVKVYGKLEIYFGTNGVKNTSDYEWVESELPKSTDATIKSLTIDGVTVAEEDGVFKYELDADFSMNQVQVEFELNDANATAVPASEEGVWMTIPTASDDTVYQYIEVTAEDGETIKNYEIILTIAAPEPGDMTDATIAWLRVDGDELTENESHEYLYEIPANFVNQYVEVTFQLSSPEATSNPDANESFLIEVPASSEVEPSKAQITVQSGDGSIEIIYWVVVSRAAVTPEASKDATIKWLKIDGVDVEEVEGVFAYEAAFEAAGSNIPVTFELNDLKATANEESGFLVSVPASATAPAIERELIVTAEDPSVKKTYTISITVAPEQQGIEDIVLTEKAQKVVVDGAVYVIRDNKMFNVTGTRVR
ncbi:MAG: cadherin-like beta sandwich domain-containing protein [Paludibacteraceae bacterium]|nr:cadherin-like beta sandwich domain-containing protein [Paludibacteraceae bacterium]